MTDERGVWETLDQAPRTPQAASAAHSFDRSRRAPLRLRRSRGPVIAGLDGGGSILQRRLRDVLVGSTIILVPAIVLNFVVTTLAFDRFNPNDTVVPSFLSDDTGFGIEDVGWLTVAVFTSFVTAVVGYFCATLLIGERFRTPIGLGDALLRTLKRLAVIAAAWVLTHWWFPPMAVIVVTAKAEHVPAWLTFFSLVSWFASAATLVVIPVMVAEQLGPVGAARRNWRLIRLRYGVCLIFVLVATGLAALLVTGLVTMVPLLAETGFVDFGSITWIVQNFVVQLAVLLVVPLIALGTAQVYIEIRVSGEGLDLMIDADTAFGRRTVSSSGSAP